MTAGECKPLISSFSWRFNRILVVVSIYTRSFVNLTETSEIHLRKTSIFWDITPCNPLKTSAWYLLSHWLLGLFRYPEEGGEMFFRNVG
jgi:hypothetical protein